MHGAHNPNLVEISQNKNNMVKYGVTLNITIQFRSKLVENRNWSKYANQNLQSANQDLQNANQDLQNANLD
jgi:hypothetical protein